MTMNYGIVRYIVGWVIKFEAAFLCLPFAVGILYRENECFAYLLVSFCCFIAGTALTFKKPKKFSFYAREGFIVVALTWILMSMIGALPFVLTGDIPSYIDALFETISGFTTTGASVLTEVESLSYTSLFWRSFTHWIGGMGVFVFVMAIIPMLGGGSTMNLMKAESPGPSVDKLVPRVKDTAKILYLIYIVITLAEVLLLVIFKMPVFDAFCSSFGTVGTGGFGIKNDSFASYTAIQQNIVTVFMIISGINYSLFFLVIHRKIKQALHLEEVRWYLGIICVAGIIISFNIRGLYDSFSEIARHAFFQVGSIITTTGFATTNFDLWPQLSKTILIILMFVGACASSTGGGMKVSRIVILFKTVKKELSLLAHPKEIKKITMDGNSVPHEVVRSVNVFSAVYFMILFVSVLLIGVDELDFTTNFTAVAATLNNIGPGMELVGPLGNYSIFSGFAKFILMFDMLAGRLELFPMLLLCWPPAWKRHS